MFFRRLFSVLMVLAIAPPGGCALWRKDAWNLDNLRDERAVDIDARLSSGEPIVQNPFGQDGVDRVQ